MKKITKLTKSICGILVFCMLLGGIGVTMPVNPLKPVTVEAATVFDTDSKTSNIKGSGTLYIPKKDVLFAYNYFASISNVSWKKVPGATGYEIRLVEPGKNKILYFYSEHTKKNTFSYGGWLTKSQADSIFGSISNPKITIYVRPYVQINQVKLYGQWASKTISMSKTYN